MRHSYDGFQQRDWTMDVSEGSPMTRLRVVMGHWRRVKLEGRKKSRQ